MRSTIGTTATSATQPIATYRPVDHSGCCSRFSTLAVTPMAATVQTTANSDQPHGPCSGPSTKGV